jgi:DNA-binding ferritin-like protein
MQGMLHGQEPMAIVVAEADELRNPCAGMVNQLIMLAAFLKEMETQSHLIHLNYEGANFLDVHQFLKGQYEAHLEQFDTIAEFVRAQDFWMPMCACGLKDALPCFQNVESHNGKEMLAVYLKNLDDLADLAVQIEPSAQQVGAIDVANYMAELVAAASKAAWFLKAILRGC